MHQVEQIVERARNEAFQIGIGKRRLVLKTDKPIEMLLLILFYSVIIVVFF